jgi:hypothetical protein
MFPSSRNLRRLEVSEADIVNFLMDYFDHARIPYIRHNPTRIVLNWKTIEDILTAVWNHQLSVIAALEKMKRSIFAKLRPSQEGASDLFVFRDQGRTVMIEAKSATGRLRPAQQDWQARAIRFGHDYRIIRSMKEAEGIVQMFSKGAL